MATLTMTMTMEKKTDSTKMTTTNTAVVPVPQRSPDYPSHCIATFEEEFKATCKRLQQAKQFQEKRVRKNMTVYDLSPLKLNSSLFYNHIKNDKVLSQCVKLSYDMCQPFEYGLVGVLEQLNPYAVEYDPITQKRKVFICQFEHTKSAGIRPLSSAENINVLIEFASAVIQSQFSNASYIKTHSRMRAKLHGHATDNSFRNTLVQACNNSTKLGMLAKMCAVMIWMLDTKGMQIQPFYHPGAGKHAQLSNGTLLIRKRNVLAPIDATTATSTSAQIPEEDNASSASDDSVTSLTPLQDLQNDDDVVDSWEDLEF